jgi:hypothetical protein
MTRHLNRDWVTRLRPAAMARYVLPVPVGPMPKISDRSASSNAFMNAT